MRREPELQNFEKNDPQRENGSIIPTRLNILLGAAAFLLALLVFKLATLTIVSGNNYLAMVNRTDATIETTVAPRGQIYDSQGRLMVANRSIPSVSFQRLPEISSRDIYSTANRLAKYLTLDTSFLTPRQRFDYYLANEKNSEAVQERLHLTKKQQASLSGSEYYRRQVDYLEKHQPNFSSEELNRAAIYTRMIQTPNLSTGTIKSSKVTDQEISSIGIRLDQFPGIRINQGWVRDYPQGDQVRSLIGSLSGSGAGLPESSLRQYLAQGYARDDTVGVSGLEQQYESALRGVNRKTRITTDSHNRIVKSTVIQPGQPGSNLQLTINAQFQKDVSNIVRDNLSKTGLSTGGYAAVINPYTGGVYAMAGWDRNNQNGQLTQNDLAPIQDPIVMGSAIKPAMVSMALQDGIITPDDSVQDDQIIRLAGSPSIHSYFNPNGNRIPLNAQEALENSSNTYMVQLALKMNGTPYSEGMGVPVSSTIWNRMRNGFAQFGLGMRTGVDLPGETPGYRGSTSGERRTSFINESFGQYDTYSVIQMARFAGTIANGGYLIKPRLVASVLKSGQNGIASSVVGSFSPTIQGQVKMSDDQWNVIKQGMWNVANGSSPYNTGGRALHELNPKVAAKTGTAEVFTNGQSTQNDTLIMYSPVAPFALAVAYPGDTVGTYGNVEKAAAAIYNAFWKDVMPRP